MPQPAACKAIARSLTALKQVCRCRCIARWPYQRPCKSGKRYCSRTSILFACFSPGVFCGAATQKHQIVELRVIFLITLPYLGDLRSMVRPSGRAAEKPPATTRPWVSARCTGKYRSLFSHYAHQKKIYIYARIPPHPVPLGNGASGHCSRDFVMILLFCTGAGSREGEGGSGGWESGGERHRDVCIQYNRHRSRHQHRNGHRHAAIRSSHYI